MPVELVHGRLPFDKLADLGQLHTDGHRDGASDLGSLPLVTDHAHEVECEGHEWQRCSVCGLGEAGHEQSIGALPF